MGKNLYNLAVITTKWGHYLGATQFQDVKNDKIRKKFSYKKIVELTSQSHSSGGMEVLQMILTVASEIEKDDKLTGQEKFDILVGEVEILTCETGTHFKKKWGGLSFPEVDIESVKSRVAHWSLTKEDIPPVKM